MSLDKWLLGFSVSEPIPKRLLSNLKRYQYNSQDNSLLSKYILCHYWNFLVKLFPLWIAPNLITLIGLLTVGSSALLAIYYSPTLSAALPSWVYYFIGASVWIYASLDAIDGKQARRTGQCGPLGELFDHGCDALNLSLMNLILPLIFGLKVDWLYMFCVFMILFGFYVVTWDEYHTHMLYLTIVSAPVEGTICFTAASIISGYKGTIAMSFLVVYYYFPGVQFWSQKISQYIPAFSNIFLGSLELKTLFPITIIFGGIGTILLSAMRVQRRNKSALLQLYPFVSFSVAIAIWLYYENILWDRSAEFLLYIGFASSHSVSSMIIAHLTLATPRLFEPSYVPAIVGSIMSLLKQCDLIKYDSNTTMQLLHIATIYSLVTYFLRAFFTINQIAGYLNIYCLSIKSKSKPT